MVELEQLLTTVSAFCQVNLPPVLLGKGLDDFEGYTPLPPLEVDKKILAFYMGGGSDYTAGKSDTIRIQAQLPGVLNPVPYHDAITEVLRKFNTNSIGFDSADLNYEGYYPGESGDGGAGSFILYEIVFLKERDDCDL